MKVTINVIKYETINGKKVGKAFSFPVDAKKMAKYKTEATVRKKVEEYIVKNGAEPVLVKDSTRQEKVLTTDLNFSVEQNKKRKTQKAY